MRTLSEELQTLQPSIEIRSNFIDQTMSNVVTKQRQQKRRIFLVLILFITITSLYIFTNELQQKKIILIVTMLLLSYFFTIETLLTHVRITSTMKKYFSPFAKVTSIASLSLALLFLVTASSTIATEQLMSENRTKEIQELIQERVNRYLGTGELTVENSDTLLYEGLSDEEKELFDKQLLNERKQDNVYADAELQNQIDAVKKFTENNEIELEVSDVANASNADSVVRFLISKEYTYEVDIYTNKVVQVGKLPELPPFKTEEVTANPLEYKQLEQQAIDLVKREEPTLDLSSLEYTHGDKTRINTNYFFRWQTKKKNEIKFIQVGLKDDGTLVSYTNGF